MPRRWRGSRALCGGVPAVREWKAWRSTRRIRWPAPRVSISDDPHQMTPQRRRDVTTVTMEHLKKKIRHVPDFPKPGILFYDITTLLQDPEGLRGAIDSLAGPFQDKGIDLVVGIESRGFIFGSAVADRIGAGFSPVRKPGKLPSRTVRATYDLEYGSDSLEIHADAVQNRQRGLIRDDLLATGGNA